LFATNQNVLVDLAFVFLSPFSCFAILGLMLTIVIEHFFRAGRSEPFSHLRIYSVFLYLAYLSILMNFAARKEVEAFRNLTCDMPGPGLLR
jgi:hypothetical protein